jgi:hypothetical protein
MLDHIRRAAVRDMLVISDSEEPIPSGITELWSAGFKCFLTIVSASATAEPATREWTQRSRAIATLVPTSAGAAVADVLSRYDAAFPEQRSIVRIRDVKGNFQRLDVTAADEPERPILNYYTPIEERDLHLLTAAELSEQEFNDFFRDSSASWRPYAAGLPWIREPDPRPGLLNYMKHLDVDGPEENKILYLVSEPGAGGTTLARSMAFACAREGYPVLMAKPLPFALDPLPVSNFLTRIRARLERPRLEGQAPSTAGPAETDSTTRRYETPWLIAFDTIHSQYREAELVQFRNEMEKAGRPVCLLVVTGPQVGAPLVNKRMSVQLAELNHVIQLEDARALGVHLNKFLTWYGRSRLESQWDHFYQEHTVRYLEGLAAFWVALSFWIQGQFDLAGCGKTSFRQYRHLLAEFRD